MLIYLHDIENEIIKSIPSLVDVGVFYLPRDGQYDMFPICFCYYYCEEKHKVAVRGGVQAALTELLGSAPDGGKHIFNWIAE